MLGCRELVGFGDGGEEYTEFCVYHTPRSTGKVMFLVVDDRDRSFAVAHTEIRAEELAKKLNDAVAAFHDLVVQEILGYPRPSQSKRFSVKKVRIIE